MNHSMNRNEKNRKFAPLNINNVFKGKSVEPQNKSYRLPGMQNIGKVSSIRRVPPPRWVPSLKAESGAEKNPATNVNSSTPSWPTGQLNEPEDSTQDKNKIAAKSTSEKTQWNNKNNKPFFLIGQEFPTLQSECNQELPQDSNAKNKELEKSKEDSKDGNISASTLNRIDALSISKSTKGDIAATGWAAEDDEPNFEEKLMFSDEESVNEVQNWHSDNDETNKAAELANNREKSEKQINLNESKWDDNTNMRFPPYSMATMPVNMPNQYIQKPYSHGIINRSSNSPNPNMMGDPNMYTNTLNEQRNERNMQYMLAVERGRQMKFNSQNNMCPGGVIDDVNHPERMSDRSRLMSNNSDTPDSLATPVESGPPGGPPLMHSMHKPHIQPHQVPHMMSAPGHNAQQPIILQQPHHSQMPMGPNSNMGSANSSMIRIQPSGPNPYMMPVHPHHVTHHHPSNANVHPTIIDQMNNAQLYEQFVEFLKKQADPGISAANTSNIPSDQSVITSQNTDITPPIGLQVKHDKKSDYSEHISQQIQQHTPSISTEKENTVDDQKHELYHEDNSDISSKDFKKIKTQQKNPDQIEQDHKKGGKPKYYKDYRPTKSNNYKDNYSNQDNDYNYFECDDEKDAYKDYSLYKQHYNQDRNRRNPNYNRRNNYNYFQNEQSYQQSSGAQADYYPKSNSLKLKQSKDSSKQNQYPTESFTNSDTALNKDVKQIEQSSVKDDDCQSYYHQHQFNDTSDRRQHLNRDKRNQLGNSRGGYNYNTTGSGKRYDSRNYKDRSGDTNQPEYSMGFAVNPKERNYYQSNYKNSRYYQSNYYNYQNQPSNSNYDYQDYYYYNEYYDSSQNYPANKQRNPRNNDTWRNSNVKDDSNKSRPQKHDLNKPNSRNVRKNDKRQASNFKDGCHDNIDNEEWETASEGGSYQSNKDRDNQKKPNNRENKKTKSQSGCSTDAYRKHDDNDDNDGGNKAEKSKGAHSTKTNTSNINVNQASKDHKTTRSETKTTSTASSLSNSTKNCSNNNCAAITTATVVSSSSIVPSTKSKNRLSDYVDGSHISVVSVDKLPEVTEQEELLYDNTEEFQEVVSRATKKNRKLEEQKRLKEQELQKQKEAALLKKNNSRLNTYHNNDKSKIKRETRKDYNTKHDRIEPTNNSNHNNYIKENVNHSKNAQHNHVSSQSYRTWENSKVTMSIGSWDNKLADNIERNVTPKPIGTPANSSWHQKAKYTHSNKNLNSDKAETSNQSSNSDHTKNKIHTSTAESIEFDYNQVSEKPPPVTDTATPTTPGSIVLKSGHDNQTPSFGDKINSVKTIWDSQREASLANSPVTTNNQQEVTVTNTVDNNAVSNSNNANVTQNNESNGSSMNSNKSTNQDSSTAISIPNVCKVKPQLQDISKKDTPDMQITQFSNNSILSNNSTTNGTRIQNTLEYPSLETNSLQQQVMHNANSEVSFTSMFPSNPTNNSNFVQMNYNISNNAAQSNSNNNNNALTPQFFDSSNQMIQQHSSQDQHSILPSKINGFFNQSSFYPPQVPTPKITNSTPIPPVSLDFSNQISNNHTMQQLLLTRQNSLSSLMPHNAMHLPIFQNGSQPVQAQTPLFPAGTPILPHTNFSSQLSQGHHHLPPQTPAHFPANYPQNFPTNAIPQNILQHQFDTTRTSISSNNHSSAAQPLNHHPQIFNQLHQFSSIDTSNDFNSPNNTAGGIGNTSITQQNKQQINHHSNIMPSQHTPNASGINGSAFMINHHNINLLMKPPQLMHTPTNFSNPPITPNPNMKPVFDSQFKQQNQLEQLDRFGSTLDMGMGSNVSTNNANNMSDIPINTNSNYLSDHNHKSNNTGHRQNPEDFTVEIDHFVSNMDSGWLQNTSKQTNVFSNLIPAKLASDHSQHRSNRYSPSSQYDNSNIRHGPPLYVNKETVSNFYAANKNCLIFQTPPSHPNPNRMYKNFPSDSSVHNFTSSNKNMNIKTFDSATGSKGVTSTKSIDGNKSGIKTQNNRQKDHVHNEQAVEKNQSNIVNKQRSSNSANYEDKKTWYLFDKDLSDEKLSNLENCSGKRSRQDSTASLTKNMNIMSSQNQQMKYKSNMMNKLSQSQKSGTSEGNVNNSNNNSQYGYDATRFSSQTAESLRCFDSGELQRVIMRLREGPVMTDEAASNNSNPTASVAPNLSHNISTESSLSIAPPRLQQNQNNSLQTKTNPIVSLSMQNRNRQENTSVCSSSNTNNNALSNSVSNSSQRNITMGFVSSHNPYNRNYGGSSKNSSVNNSNVQSYHNSHRTNLVNPFHHHNYSQYYPHHIQNGFNLNHRLMSGPPPSNNRSVMPSPSTAGYYNSRNNTGGSKSSNKFNSEPKKPSENTSKEINDSIVIKSEVLHSAKATENSLETNSDPTEHSTNNNLSSLDDTLTEEISSSHLLDQQQHHHNSSHHCDNTNKLIVENVV